MRHTVRGIILQNRRILLVTGHNADFYWTPGGGVEPGESVVETLHREIREELGVSIKEYKPYLSYVFEDQTVDNFLITVEGDIRVGEEITGYAWYSSQATVKPSNGFTNALMPKLIKDGLIT